MRTLWQSERFKHISREMAGNIVVKQGWWCKSCKPNWSIYYRHLNWAADHIMVKPSSLSGEKGWPIQDNQSCHYYWSDSLCASMAFRMAVLFFPIFALTSCPLGEDVTWLKPHLRPIAWFESESDDSGDCIWCRACEGVQLAWDLVGTRRSAVRDSSGGDDGYCGSKPSIQLQKAVDTWYWRRKRWDTLVSFIFRYARIIRGRMNYARKTGYTNGQDIFRRHNVQLRTVSADSVWSLNCPSLF